MTARPCAAAPRHSGRLLVRLAPADVALFRFLLEAYENLAFFTTLERRTALLKVMYSPQQESAVRAALTEISESVPLTVEEWPFAVPDQSPA
ncbi:MAG: DUF4911 domain-containing protein [Desulfovibrio sp.]|nr:DUF4911 domain-containing protein [Desulfovibrio sp.]